MRTYAIVNESGLVINVVLWDGISEFNVEGLVDITGIPVGIGWTYSDGYWIAPPEPQQQEE